MPVESEVEHIQLHDTKTVFYLVVVDENDAAVDISAASVLEIYYKRPITKDTFQRTGTVHDGPNGIMKYALAIGDANEVGLFEIQGYVVTPTWNGFTEIGTFYVEDNIIKRFWGSTPAFMSGA